MIAALVLGQVNIHVFQLDSDLRSLVVVAGAESLAFFKS